jgi:esterase/lipase
MFFKKAVLIIHGFSGNVADNQSLHDYLKENSEFDVYDFHYLVMI